MGKDGNNRENEERNSPIITVKIIDLTMDIPLDDLLIGEGDVLYV